MKSEHLRIHNREIGVTERARRDRLSSHSIWKSCATEPGEPHTFEILQATGVRPFGYQGLITLDYGCLIHMQDDDFTSLRITY